MNLLKDIPAGTEDEVNFICENTKGSNNKYEYNKELNIFSLDRAMYSAFAYPSDYGFIPQTHCDDGDALDGFLFVDQGTPTGVHTAARIVGVIYMNDSGEEDNKLILVAADDPNHAHIKDLGDLPPFFVKKVQHFLESYKNLKGKKVVVSGIKGAKEAKAEFKKAVEAYKSL